MKPETSEIWYRGELQRRYKHSRLTQHRWEKKGLLPPPDVMIGGRPGWYVSTILEHERASTGRAVDFVT